MKLRCFQQIGFLAVVTVALACSGPDEKSIVTNEPPKVAASPTPKPVEKSDKHEHSAPHGGTLIAFGDEFAHLEIVIDAANGAVTAYALDGEAEKSGALAQETIEIEIAKPEKLKITLDAAENTLTGEKKGATSEFRAQNDKLRNLKEFDARIVEINIRGRVFKNVGFNFPKGNEHQH